MIIPLPSYGRQSTRWVREMRQPGQVEASSPNSSAVLDVTFLWENEQDSELACQLDAFMSSQLP